MIRSNGDLYTADTGGGTVSAIDPTADTVTTIPLGPPSDWNVTQPSAVTANAGSDLIYVTDGGTDNLSVINATSQTVALTLAVGVDPDAVLVDPSNSRVYVANCGSDNLTVFNSSSRVNVGSVPVGICPDSVAVAPSGQLLFVANYFGPGGTSNLTVVNLTTAIATASISTGGAADGLSVDPANGYVYVANGYANDVVVINATTLAAAGPPIAVTLGSYETYPTAVVFDPATWTVFVPAAFTSGIYVIANAPSVAFAKVTPFPSEVGVPFEIELTVENGTAPYLLCVRWLTGWMLLERDACALVFRRDRGTVQRDRHGDRQPELLRNLVGLRDCRRSTWISIPVRVALAGRERYIDHYLRKCVGWRVPVRLHVRRSSHGMPTH